VLGSIGAIPKTNEIVFSFDTGGGAQHIMQGYPAINQHAEETARGIYPFRE
jgi:hypothetical protein